MLVGKKINGMIPKYLKTQKAQIRLPFWIMDKEIKKNVKSPSAMNRVMEDL